jgi:GntR family transcriptional regulator
MLESPIRNISLATQVEQVLINRIKEGVYLPGEQIPTEEQLADEFDVSRATIRAAFNKMTANRIIIRRHGVGTFVSKAAKVSNPLDQSINFLDLISTSGFKADFEEEISRVVVPPEDVITKLGLEEGQRVLEVHKVFLADNLSVIYSENYIPEWVFKGVFTEEEIIKPGVTEPFFEFFRDVCKCEIQYYFSNVSVGMPSEFPLIVDPMDVEKDTPILVIDEIGYDKHERPVNYAIEYLPGNRMQYSLIRKCMNR